MPSVIGDGARITREGSFTSTVSSSPEVAMTVLTDPVAVTVALGDLLDQQRSSSSAPVRWVLPRMHVAGATLRTALLPRWSVSPRAVEIAADADESSDTDARLRLAMAIGDGPPTTMSTDWRMTLLVPLPRAVVRLANPALDRAVASVVDRIMARLTRAIEGHDP